MNAESSVQSAASHQRVVSYVDGFNLYYGLSDAGFRRYLWLNVHELSRRLLLPHQLLGMTKYFTARISGAKPTDRPDYARGKNAKRKRQATYLDALGSIAEIQTFEGHYLEDTKECRKCGARWWDSEEKMTDVNIATEMLTDAFDDLYDTALLISGDSDLVPPIKAILSRFEGKRVVVAFPPERHSIELEKAATCQFIIGRAHLNKSQFPDAVPTSSGFVLKKPAEWQVK